jgi:hypothetical protein
MDNPAARIPNFTRSRFLLHIVFASTSGHMEYVVDSLIDSLKDIGRDNPAAGFAKGRCPPARLRDMEYPAH